MIIHVSVNSLGCKRVSDTPPPHTHTLFLFVVAAAAFCKTLIKLNLKVFFHRHLIRNLDYNKNIDQLNSQISI